MKTLRRSKAGIIVMLLISGARVEWPRLIAQHVNTAAAAVLGTGRSSTSGTSAAITTLLDPRLIVPASRSRVVYTDVTWCLHWRHCLSRQPGYDGFADSRWCGILFSCWYRVVCRSDFDVLIFVLQFLPAFTTPTRAPPDHALMVKLWPWSCWRQAGA